MWYNEPSSVLWSISASTGLHQIYSVLGSFLQTCLCAMGSCYSRK